MKVTEHEDGTVDVLRTARYNDVGLAIAETRDADDAVDRRAALLAAAPRRRRLVRRRAAAARRQQRRGARDGNLRLDLSADDLEALQQLAREQLADQVELNGDGRPTAEEIGESLADGDGIVEWDDTQADFGAPLQRARRRADARGDADRACTACGPAPDSVAAELQSLLLDAGVELPGEIVTPDCG